MSSVLDKLNLRPQERRLVVIVSVIVFIALNLGLVFPRFGEVGKTQQRAADAQKKLQQYREEIARQVRSGRTDNEVRAAISQQYPDAVQLRPPASGASSLIWVLPVFVLVAFTAGLVTIFRRGRR